MGALSGGLLRAAFPYTVLLCFKVVSGDRDLI